MDAVPGSLPFGQQLVTMELDPLPHKGHGSPGQPAGENSQVVDRDLRAELPIEGMEGSAAGSDPGNTA